MAPMISVSWPQVMAFRLDRQHLLTRAPRSHLIRVVRDICGIQAQLMSAAELVLWARVDGLSRQDVGDALWKRRSLVKTWCMRGALHLLPARDFGLWVGALSPRSVPPPAWLRYFGLTRGSLEQVINGVWEALDGRTLTREELASAIARQMGPGMRRKLLSGWGSIFKPSAYQGRLCFGPSRGQNITFVRPDQWLGEWDEVDQITAINDIARRYLRTYGPATADDFGHWWGGRRSAKSVLRGLSDDVTEIDIDGHVAWALREDVPLLRRQRPADVVRLLPHFDMYTYGFRPRSHLVPDRFAARVFREAGWISPIVVINGIAAGTWELRRVGRVAEVTVQPFVPLRRPFTSRLKDEAHRLEPFLDLPVRVVI